MKMQPKPKPVKAYLEHDEQGALVAWWDDPRSKSPSMKYPVLVWIFSNIVEKFRYEGMQVVVNWLGQEKVLEPTNAPNFVYRSA